jgi:hypothetical protein
MNRLESALRTILGYWPTYMRPPFFATNDLVLNTMRELGYHVIHADIDTLDWANQSEGGIEESVRRFRDGLNAGGSIALAHDVHFWTARRLTPAMIDEVRRRGLRGVYFRFSFSPSTSLPRFFYTHVTLFFFRSFILFSSSLSLFLTKQVSLVSHFFLLATNKYPFLQWGGFFFVGFVSSVQTLTQKNSSFL